MPDAPCQPIGTDGYSHDQLITRLDVTMRPIRQRIYMTEVQAGVQMPAAPQPAGHGVAARHLGDALIVIGSILLGAVISAAYALLV